MTIRKRLSGPLLWSLLPLLLCLPVAFATEGEETSAIDFTEDAEPGIEDRRAAREAELVAIRRSIEVSERRQAALGEEIEGLQADQAELTAELIATGQRMRAAEAEISSSEARLAELHASEDIVRASLRQQRDTMAEVLMALQRMGRTPPPAIISRPEDALAAIRGSILAGAVLPDIRAEAEELAADLTVLTDLAAEIQGQRESLRASYTALGEEQARIDLLVASKQAQHEQTEAALSAEQERAAELAGEAESVESLIASIEAEITAAAAAEEERATAERLAAETAEAQEAQELDERRIAPAVRFADARGQLSLPVLGERILEFGERDEFGESQGLKIAARPGTPVLAPADGWVVYAGPFRSYGQVLILNAGDDYHIVMAGMARIDVALRQFVLAGEPVAEMGATRLASLGELDHTSAQSPVLYVEFRRSGRAIDSAPWWVAEATDGEVNG